MKKITTKTILFFCIFFFNLTGYGQNIITILNQDNYLNHVLTSIRSAKKEIIILMPYIPIYQENGLTSEILKELSLATKRNVTVKIYTDYSNAKQLLPEGNIYALEKFCKKNDIFLMLDTPSAKLNNRLIIIDREIIIGGSAVLSDSIINNYETSFLIKSKETAQKLIEDINTIALKKDIEDEENKNFAYIPNSFIKDTLPEIVKYNDPLALDIYLSFIRHQKNGKALFDIKTLKNEINLKRKNTKSAARKIHKALKHLVKKYKVIKIKKINSKKAFVYIIQNPGETKTKLPKTYWEYEWYKKLSLQAKAVLLIILQSIDFRKNEFFFTTSLKGIVSTYKIILWNVKTGFLDLLKYNIISLINVNIEGKEEDYAITFSFNFFYDLNDYYIKYNQLSKTIGPKKASIARNFASIIYKKYDINTITLIARQIDSYGIETVRKKFGKIVNSKAFSPQRSTAYFGRIINR